MYNNSPSSSGSRKPFSRTSPRPGSSRPGAFSSAPRAAGSRPGTYAGSNPRPAGSYSSSNSRPPFRGGSSSRPPFRGGNRFGGGSRSGGGKRPHGVYIDPNKFINKAVITEEIENFKPEHKFDDFAVNPILKQAIKSKGYELPTPIQDRTIPHILQGADIVGIANTGTGKTAAFLIPLINKVLLNPKEQVMILAPTRELAIQINEELKGFTRGMKMFSVCCVGGMSITKQISDLRYQYNFIIGTPGRIKDLIERRMIILSEFNSIVLDEADRMLDMGFINDMRLIMAGMPKKRHTLFFSATLSPEIEKLIHEFLNQPVRISVKTRDTAKNIDQDVVRVLSGMNKLDMLSDLLQKKDFTKVIVFSRTKHGAEKLSKLLMQKGIKVESIHGDKNHSKRQQALKSFKENKVQVLVATDVAARGLDIAEVSHVINYDIPATYDDYVHRIGRTGRGDKKGKALTFLE
jgi:ATP-dependent RNA helicase RhlE